MNTPNDVMRLLLLLVVAVVVVVVVAAGRTFDCVTFNGEFEMLEVRVLTLRSLVDVFVVLEDDTTYTNKPKPRYLQQALDEGTHPVLTSIRNRLRIVPGPKAHVGNAWAVETASRNALKTGLWDAQPNDYVLISDIDEIPKPDALRSVLKRSPVSSHGFMCVHYYWNFGWRNANKQYGMPVLYRYDKLRNMQMQSAFRVATHRSEHACWHCAFGFGPSVDAAVRQAIVKMHSFSHSEYDRSPYIDYEYMRDSLLRGLSPVRTETFVAVNASEEAPPAVLLSSKYSFLLGKYMK